jgi:FixJ family two-component response regulator
MSELDGVEVSILSYVVDDDTEVLRIIEQLLNATDGIKRFKTFSEPQEFLKQLGSDIVVCAIDYFLQTGLTGLDVLRAVKKKNKGSFVIMISGADNPAILIKLINSGVDRYVNKNNKDYLRELVEYMIEGLSEAQKKWTLINFLENKKSGNE